jgi:hypothetical protein
MFRDARKGQFEWQNTIAPLLGDRAVLLAMKHQRAPLPISSALWKALLRRGFPNDLNELGNFTRHECSWPAEHPEKRVELRPRAKDADK